MSKDIKLGNFYIGKNHKPFIIAEMSGNHNQSLDRALKIVEKAAECGAHGVKLQTYTADTMTLDLKEGPFYIDDPSSLWNGYSLHDLYKKAYTPWEWHQPIYERCHKLGMICFSTPFDASSVDFLEDLNNPIYKIASFEVTDIPLLKKVASTGKPVIASTGMASVGEIEEMVLTLKSHGAGEIVLLKCTSTYPASPDNTNILTIPHLRKLFDVHVGLSDHTLGIGVAVASVALGSRVIEKHFTLDRSEGGVDSAFSMEPTEMKSLVVESERAFLSLGQVNYGGTEKESKSKIFRRSLFIGEDVKIGDVLTKESLRVIRPSVGLEPKYYDHFIGKKVSKNLKKGTPVSWDII